MENLIRKSDIEYFLHPDGGYYADKDIIDELPVLEAFSKEEVITLLESIMNKLEDDQNEYVERRDFDMALGVARAISHVKSEIIALKKTMNN